MGSLAGPKARREPAGEAKPDVCVISDGKAGAYYTVGLVFLIFTDFYLGLQKFKLTEKSFSDCFKGIKCAGCPF